MAYADLNERAVLALRNRFVTNLPGAIDQVNATTLADPARNQTTIAHPAQVLDAPPVSRQLISFPIYSIADGEMLFTDDVGWAATGEYDLYALLHDTDPDPTALAWKLRRGLQALVTVAADSRNMESGSYLGGWGVVVQRIIPGKRLSRMDAAGQPELMGWAAVLLQVKDEQQYP